MMEKNLLFIASFLLLMSCATIPKEAVELSATVGRDMAEMKSAHINLVNLYYERLLRDINRFIDDVYMPYQIQNTLADDTIKTTLLNAIESANEPDPEGTKQKECIVHIETYLQMLNEEVESYRHQKTKPIKDQQKALLKRLNESYNQIHYANSIVTGHLASVVKVHESQNEVLSKLDLKDLREKVSVKAADISDNIFELLEQSKQKDAELDKIIKEFENVIK